MGVLAMGTACVVLTVWMLATDEQSTVAAAPQGAPDVPPVARVERCGAARERAREHARELERLARAHFERVPFDEAEAPSACVSIDEAERCYELAQDREGRARSAALHGAYVRELAARLKRHRFLLEVARREGSLSGIEREARALLSLYGRSGQESARYREELSLMARRARAEALERARSEKEHSP
jgi:hypothetical protein